MILFRAYVSTPTRSIKTQIAELIFYGVRSNFSCLNHFFLVKTMSNGLSFFSTLQRNYPSGPSIKYVHPKTAIFEPPTHPCTQKYALALPPTPPLYKRILETHFQNINPRISIELILKDKSFSRQHQVFWIDLLFIPFNTDLNMSLK